MIAAAVLAAGLATEGCHGASSANDGEAEDAMTPPFDGQPAICAEFTEAGAPCPLVSPVRCFPECDAGGCFCLSTPAGARWTCRTDLSCVADCAPIDDGCAPVPTGSDEAAIEGSADAGVTDATATDASVGDAAMADATGVEGADGP